MPVQIQFIIMKRFLTHLKKSKLDPAKLNFIHVNASAQTVAIRNLIICFEKQNHLHPTIDKDFKKNISIVKTT